MVFYVKTYQKWLGRRGDGGRITRNYKTEMFGEDFYWLTARDLIFSSGTAGDAPDGAAPGVVKTGARLSNENWKNLYDQFHNERTWE